MAAERLSLAVYLRRAGARPFVYGETDCLLFVADWILAATGIDAAAPWRGRYACAAGARALLVGAAGLLPLVGCAMRRAGFVRTTQPNTGDVVVVGTALGHRCGIAAGASRVVLRAQRGVVAASFPIVAAWGLAAHG